MISSQNNSRYTKRKKDEDEILKKMDEEEKKKFREGKKSKVSRSGRNEQAIPKCQKSTERICIRRQETVRH